MMLMSVSVATHVLVVMGDKVDMGDHYCNRVGGGSTEPIRTTESDLVEMCT
jgi:hypothetical protein